MACCLLRNVSYTYPGNHTPALKDISLVLEAGETLAIVGYNGSGGYFLIRKRFPLSYIKTVNSTVDHMQVNPRLRRSCFVWWTITVEGSSSMTKTFDSMIQMISILTSQRYYKDFPSLIPRSRKMSALDIYLRHDRTTLLRERSSSQEENIYSIAFRMA